MNKSCTRSGDGGLTGTGREGAGTWPGRGCARAPGRASSGQEAGPGLWLGRVKHHQRGPEAGLRLQLTRRPPFSASPFGAARQDAAAGRSCWGLPDTAPSPQKAAAQPHAPRSPVPAPPPGRLISAAPRPRRGAWGAVGPGSRPSGRSIDPLVARAEAQSRAARARSAAAWALAPARPCWPSAAAPARRRPRAAAL